MLRFEYLRPATLSELFEQLQHYGPTARILAGGTDLLVRLQHASNGVVPVPTGNGGQELNQVRAVIDIKRLEEIPASIRREKQHLIIGARAVMTDIAGQSDVQKFFPALVDAVRVVGSIQIRNRATIAGNICNASPAADTIPALLAFDAVVVLRGPSGERRVPLRDFFLGPGRTVRETAEVVISVELPLPVVAVGSAFGRVTRRKGVDLATINLACALYENGRALFGYGAVGPTPILAVDESGRLCDPSVGDPEREEHLAKLIERATPISDVRSGEDYRRAMLLTMTRRIHRTALDALVTSQKGES